MKAPSFWSVRPPNRAARLLQPLGAAYGAATLARMRKAGARAALPVVCVGNVTAGGAGKTPVALALAGMLAGQGFAPVFLSRGYGGNVKAPTRVDPASHAAGDVGDEPLLLARAAPTIVAPDRVAGAALAARHGDVIIMDDGLQNPALVKDFTLCVVDGGAGFGNGLVMPAGPLRAPARAQAEYIDAVLLLGTLDGAGQADARRLASAIGEPLYSASLQIDPAAATRLAGLDVLAYAGIGRPEKFFATLDAAGARLAVVRAFADHHPFTAADAQALLAEARAKGLALVTTEKDAARLTSPALAGLAAASLAVPVSVTLPQPLAEAIVTAISARS